MKRSRQLSPEQREQRAADEAANRMLLALWQQYAAGPAFTPEAKARRERWIAEGWFLVGMGTAGLEQARQMGLVEG